MVLLYVKKTTCCCFTFSYLFPNGLAVCQENNMLALYSYVFPNDLAVCQKQQQKNACWPFTFAVIYFQMVFL